MQVPLYSWLMLDVSKMKCEQAIGRYLGDVCTKRTLTDRRKPALGGLISASRKS